MLEIRGLEAVPLKLFEQFILHAPRGVDRRLTDPLDHRLVFFREFIAGGDLLLHLRECVPQSQFDFVKRFLCIDQRNMGVFGTHGYGPHKKLESLKMCTGTPSSSSTASLTPGVSGPA